MKRLRLQFGKMVRYVRPDSIDWADIFQGKDGKFYIKLYGPSFESYADDKYKQPFLMLSFDDKQQFEVIQAQLKELGIVQ